MSTNASLTSPGSASCGGTLINRYYILTAAHCFASVQASHFDRYFAVVGAQYRNDTNSVRYTIKSIIIHSQYDSDTYENDIALVQLSLPVDFNDSTVGFSCLPPNGAVNYPNESMNATALGWGSLEQGGSSAYALQQVELPIVSNQNSYCADVLVTSSTQFCAGFISGGKDTCQGDRY